MNRPEIMVEPIEGFPNQLLRRNVVVTVIDHESLIFFGSPQKIENRFHPEVGGKC
jgi:hypothetical protein